MTSLKSDTEQPIGVVKVVTLVGGPADGQVFGVGVSCKILNVPIMQDLSKFDENDPLRIGDIIDWDDYGPRYKLGIKQATYRVDGDKAVYCEDNQNSGIEI